MSKTAIVRPAEGTSADGAADGAAAVTPQKVALTRNASYGNFVPNQDASLSIFVIGASGDLAKKKTYPSLLALFIGGFLPQDVGEGGGDAAHRVRIVGYSRSKKTDDEFRAHLRPYLVKKAQSVLGSDGGGGGGGGGGGDPAAVVDRFLRHCVYRPGQYDGEARMAEVAAEALRWEEGTGTDAHHRMFYMAIPPLLFVPVGTVVSRTAQSGAGWNRVIVEKPFGHDSESARQLSTSLAALFDETQLYRIDHYLGKEMVQNLLVMRFGNIQYEPLWNRDFVNCVIITFKEDIGTFGRGGYFDKSGIIKDVIQNHLMQVLSLVAMEAPVRCAGRGYSNFVRDEKVKVLRCIPPVAPGDVVLGQYAAGVDPRTGEAAPGYTDDPSVPTGADGRPSQTETFATVVLRVNNARWEGVPFILKAGKALNQRKAEIRIQFKQPPGSRTMFPGMEVPNNELVMRLQPNEAVYFKTNVKQPGLKTRPSQVELDLSYQERFADSMGNAPDAYTRLLLDVLRGKQATFVRDDELQAAWDIFTPLLHKMYPPDGGPRSADVPEVVKYAFGSRGPEESDRIVRKLGYRRWSESYEWPGKGSPASAGAKTAKL